MRLDSGARVGPYEISGPIGAGGMGEVYRARDTRLGREVAIKVLPADVTNDSERLARFKREACSASALNHRNIVTVHDFTSSDGEAWLVMELIRGESLRDVISRGPLPVKKLLSIAIGIADGLAAAHAAGLVHRDLKPENVMISNDGTPKILDFGLVKAAPLVDTTNAPTTPQVTRAGTVLGTTAYMSPEQARGSDVDFRTDQFSFGDILYEMVTGENPFRRGTAMDTVAAILNDDPPRIAEPFGWIVERCLEKNPADRYGSTADLAHDLRRVAASPSPAAARPRAHVWPIALAVLIAAIAIAALLLRPKAATLPAMHLSLSTPAIDQIALGEILPPVAISPDGRLAVIAGTGSDGVDRLWLEELRSGRPTAISGSEHAHGIAFSSDSRSIAFCAGGKMKTTSVDGGPARAICDVIPPGQLSWSGNTILFSQPAGIHRVSAAGGTPRIVVPADPTHPADVPMWPEFLPDGHHFLYLAINRRVDVQHQLMVASIDGGARKPVGTIESRAAYADGHLLYVRDGTLVAQRFDPDSQALSGDARPLVDDIFYFRSTGLASFAVSQNGLLIWRVGRRPSRGEWLDRVGTASGSIGEAIFAGGRLSPDGSRYAVAVVGPKDGTGDIWIYDLARQTSQRLTFRSTDELNPVWSPDAKTIYYRSDALGPPDVFRWDLGEDQGKLVYRGPAIEQPEDVSPDGRFLLMLSYNRANGRRIIVLTLGRPGDARPFSATPFNDASPRFSPDGRFVAYESDASGRPEIYTRAFAGAALPVRISSDGGTKPRWRHDGRELFFLAPGGKLMSVPMQSGAATSAPHLLFQTNAIDFEPAADGSRFLMQIEERTADPPVHLLTNWKAGLEGT